jgi:hypothetical protein
MAAESTTQGHSCHKRIRAHTTVSNSSYNSMVFTGSTDKRLQDASLLVALAHNLVLYRPSFWESQSTVCVRTPGPSMKSVPSPSYCNSSHRSTLQAQQGGVVSGLPAAAESAVRKCSSQVAFLGASCTLLLSLPEPESPGVSQHRPSAIASNPTVSGLHPQRGADRRLQACEGGDSACTRFMRARSGRGHAECGCVRDARAHEWRACAPWRARWRAHAWREYAPWRARWRERSRA